MVFRRFSDAKKSLPADADKKRIIFRHLKIFIKKFKQIVKKKFFLEKILFVMHKMSHQKIKQST